MFTCCFAVVPAADLELGLKRDTLGAVDGSSLEALLKGEPLDRRSGASDLRGPEEDLAAAEPPATSAATHTSSGRVRKVRPNDRSESTTKAFCVFQLCSYNLFNNTNYLRYTVVPFPYVLPVCILVR